MRWLNCRNGHASAIVNTMERQRLTACHLLLMTFCSNEDSSAEKIYKRVVRKREMEGNHTPQCHIEEGERLDRYQRL